MNKVNSIIVIPKEMRINSYKLLALIKDDGKTKMNINKMLEQKIDGSIAAFINCVILKLINLYRYKSLVTKANT